MLMHMAKRTVLPALLIVASIAALPVMAESAPSPSQKTATTSAELYAKAAKDQDESHQANLQMIGRAKAQLERQEKDLTRSEATMDRQEKDLSRYEKIIDTWEQQQAEYQLYLDSLKPK